MFDPGETVGGVKATGWIDLLTGITAHKRFGTSDRMRLTASAG